MACPSEIALMCRLCLLKDKQQVNIPIFEDHSDSKLLVKISALLPIKIFKEDQLPKNICDGCSDKLNLLYEFWNVSLESERTLLSWLKNDNLTISALAEPIEETIVKEEVEVEDESPYLDLAQHSSMDEFQEAEEEDVEEPPSKRPRRLAAMKAGISIATVSDDDNYEDGPQTEDVVKLEFESDENDNSEDIAKLENESDNDISSSVPENSTHESHDQPGPSGLGKSGTETPPTSTTHHSRYHWCIVPMCENTSIKTPQKTFIQVPRQENRRKLWLDMVRRNPKQFSKATSVFVCEDHFDLENDMENYLRWKMMGGPKLLKQEAFPHKFECQKKSLTCEVGRIEPRTAQSRDVEHRVSHCRLSDARDSVSTTRIQKMGEENQIVDKLKRKRELTNARVKKYRERKQIEYQRLNSSKQEDPRVQSKIAERKKAMSKERSRRYRERKRLLKSVHHVVHESQIPGPSR
ncbi:unnamed protein product [Ceutorhynchus assimilis]|uniref:Uncharacterized protein n=1 Tax=Ceutorhynchus assimilis TaxID=467358 RepID=A0A9P0DKF2_9CUCU|nr:unnamed protein product [Ceutorhynchus assimilis]